MKKIVTLLLASVFVSAMAFGQDAPAPAMKIGASVVLDGNLWGVNGFQLNNKKQKDGDLLQFSIDAGTAGASFNLIANLQNAGLYDVSQSSTVNMRQAKVWFKPFNELKVNLGWVSPGLFTEQLNWWMVTTGQSYAAASSWNGRWQAATAEEYGLGLDFNPVEGLSISAAVVPGADKNFLFTGEAVSAAEWGANVKYSIKDFGAIGASYTDKGYGNHKYARLGFDCNAVPGLYFFLQGVFSFENVGGTAAGTANYKFNGLALDPYVALSASGFSAKLTVPFIFRLSDAGSATDPSYFVYDLKLSYQVLDNLTPFFRIMQNGDKSNVYGMTLNGDANSEFAPALWLGADYSIGKASLMTAVRIDLGKKGYTGPLSWAIPFEARVSF